METPHSILKKFFGYDSFRPGQEQLYLGFIDGNARHDYRSAANDFNAFLLPTFYYQ